MADEIDIAADMSERFLSSAVAYRQPEGPSPIGRCFSCGEPLPAGKRWCDADCRNDWERELNE